MTEAAGTRVQRVRGAVSPPAPGDPMADFPRALVRRWLAQSSLTPVEGRAKLAVKAWMAEHNV